MLETKGLTLTVRRLCLVSRGGEVITGNSFKDSSTEIYTMAASVYVYETYVFPKRLLRNYSSGSSAYVVVLRR